MQTLPIAAGTIEPVDLPSRQSEPPATGLAAFFRQLTSRRGGWITLAVVLLSAFALIGGLRTDADPGRGAELPPAAEAAVAAAQRAELPGGDTVPLFAVATRDGTPLTADDRAALDTLSAQLGQTLPTHTVGIPSEDSAAMLLTLPLKADQDPAAQVETARADVQAAQDANALPGGLDVHITGGPAFGVDIAGAFSGVNYLLLGVTIAIVTLLLLLTYRSPLLLLIPLAVVAIADQAAAAVATFAGVHLGFGFDAGIVSVLVFGAGTNYALLLISRYREELARTVSRTAFHGELATGWHRSPLARATAATVPVILASNVTVVLALLALLAASVPATRGIGAAAAIGLALTLVIVATGLPAMLAVAGPGVFWPRNPARHPATAQKLLEHRGLWAKVGQAVNKRPGKVLAAGTLVLALATTGLIGTSLGLSQTERFRVESESTAGLAAIAEHYPAGAATPLSVVADAGLADEVRSAVATVPGMAVQPTQPGAPAAGAGERVLVRVNGDAEPGSEAAFAQVRDVREAVHAVDSTAVVGGSDAEALDAREAAVHNLKVILPIIVAIVAIVVGLLLRSWLIAVVIMVVDVVSALAAMGLGTFLGRVAFGFPALDMAVPLLAVLFLVALGVDYSLFLAHRVRQEAARDAADVRSVSPAVTRALAATGGVITSAGVVLAAVFAALGVLPLVTLLQIGVIVCVGVLIDTLLVRTVIMPTLFMLLPAQVWGVR